MCSKHLEYIDAYEILEGNPELKRPLRKCKQWWKGNITKYVIKQYGLTAADVGQNQFKIN